MGFLTDDELDALIPAEMLPHTTPIPTQIVSSDEYIPAPQSEKQKQVEARLLDMGEEFGKPQGLDRREFFQTAAGMAAAFVAMNDTFGALFDVSRAEAATPAMAQERADLLKDQFIMDMHTHFLRDDTRIQTFVRGAGGSGQARVEPGARRQAANHRGPEVGTTTSRRFPRQRHQGRSDLQRPLRHCRRTGSSPTRWRLQPANASTRKPAPSACMHTPSSRRATGLARGCWSTRSHMKPDSIKGYTIGDNTNKPTSDKYPWRMDDEQITYKAYELCVKHGIKNICVHKGLFPAFGRKAVPAPASTIDDVRDVGKAAKDWPQLNFVVYHSAYRHSGGGNAASRRDRIRADRPLSPG